MAALCWLTHLLCVTVIIPNIIASDLQESFYNELRNILNNRPAFIDDSIPRPIEVKGWGVDLQSILGQVSGVSVNPLGQPVVFHRGHRVWDNKSFNSTHHYQYVNEGPIKVNTVVVLDPENGSILSSWGSNMFYLPHGITVDHKGNTWLTDVAMHQVLKFPAGWRRPSLRLGEFLKPGHGATHFCKPTSIAVATSGEVFVADGYCNKRVVKFSRDGKVLRIFPHYGEFLSLVVPHSLSLIENKDLLCVADRENMRVVCFVAELRQNRRMNNHFSPLTIHQPDFGRVFAIASRGDLVYAVNGPTSSHIPIQGFTLDPFSETIVDHWIPHDKQGFTNPHDIAVSPKGDSLYVCEIGPNKVWKFTLGYGI